MDGGAKGRQVAGEPEGDARPCTPHIWARPAPPGAVVVESGRGHGSTSVVVGKGSSVVVGKEDGGNSVGSGHSRGPRRGEGVRGTLGRGH